MLAYKLKSYGLMDHFRKTVFIFLLIATGMAFANQSLLSGISVNDEKALEATIQKNLVFPAGSSNKKFEALLWEFTLPAEGMKNLEKDVMKYRNSVEKMPLPKSQKFKSGGGGGGMDGGGGSGLELEFFRIAQAFMATLQSTTEGQKISEGFDLAIRRTKVEFVTYELYLKGDRKDAINYPEQEKIVVNSQSWKNISYQRRMALVVHEYLGIMNIDDRLGQYSKYFLSKVFIPYRTYENIKGQEGSEIYLYDQFVEKFSEIERTNSEEKQKLSAFILKKFVGVHEVIFKNTHSPRSEDPFSGDSSSVEATDAWEIATAAKSYLPYNPANKCFVNLRGECLRTRASQRPSLRFVPPKKTRTIIVFDGNSRTLEFKEDTFRGTCTLSIGGDLTVKASTKVLLYMNLLRTCVETVITAPQPDIHYPDTMDR